MADAAGAIVMTPDRLRPQAEGAARLAPAAGIERYVGVPQIAAEIILDDEIAFVDRRDERKLVHVLQYRAVGVVDDDAISVAPGEPGDAREVAPLGHILDGEIELIAGDEIDHGRSLQARLRLDRDLRPDHADLQTRLERLERLGGAHVDGERRRRGMHHDEVATGGLGRDVGELEPVRRRVDEL